MYIFHWSHAPPHTTESNLCCEWTKGEIHSPWLRREYNTSILMPRIRSRSSAKFWVLLLNNQTVVRSLFLNTIDPQPLLSSTYKIKDWKLFYQSRLSNTVGRKTKIYEQGHDWTSRLIESGLSSRPSDQIRAKVVCSKSLTTLAGSSMTAQPPGFCSSALQVATHG